MSETERELFEEYKRVDRICRDMFSSQSGVSQYIAEMERDASSGRCAAASWDGDYRMLKRARWLRNQIAHESCATDCGDEDAAWLRAFHTRLLERQDPLALLEESNRRRLKYAPRRETCPGPAPEVRGDRTGRPRERRPSPKPAALALIGLAAAAALLVLRWVMAL